MNSHVDGFYYNLELIVFSIMITDSVLEV